ncbi:phosphotransferase family protein [Actinoplanes sp. URMC 104]|uniref:phosphotransferase family protein n=1 Tax=Actinoplanes sp. URMC 104 TaxID=3423409 RepID=UPI003F1E3D03
MNPTWLPAPTVEALRAALRTVAPDLADRPVRVRRLIPETDPQWCAATAVVDDRVVVKFAWSHPAALRVCAQARTLTALRTAAPQLPLPEVVGFSRTPALLLTRYEPAEPFFAVRPLITPADHPAVAHDLASVLAALHDPALLDAVPDPVASALPATTGTLRARLGPHVRPDQRDHVLSWCEWADRALAAPARTVLVHGDLHGDNHLWDPSTLRLRLLVDLETAGPGEPEFDFRCLPADCGAELFPAVVARYEQLTRTRLDVGRILAWHLRTVLDDVLWRTEAGVPLPDNRTPSDWVDDLAARLDALRR